MKKINAFIPNLIGNLQNQFQSVWIPAAVYLEPLGYAQYRLSREAGMTNKKNAVDKINGVLYNMDFRFYGNNQQIISLRPFSSLNQLNH